MTRVYSLSTFFKCFKRGCYIESKFSFIKKGGIRSMGEYEFLIGLISNTGFPIIAFLLIFWKFDKSLGLLAEAVNNNTNAVQLLLQKENQENKNK